MQLAHVYKLTLVLGIFCVLLQSGEVVSLVFMAKDAYLILKVSHFYLGIHREYSEHSSSS